MGSISLTLPTIGQPNSTEDVKISNALSALQTFVNGTNFGTSQIEALAVTAAKIETQQAWQTIALSTFASNLNYFKDSLGMVHFRGDSNTSAAGISSGTTLCTLGAGFRPVSKQYFNIHFVSSTSGQIISITSAGVVAMETTLAAGQPGMFFGTVHFRAEN